jgi:co-chaperonin GroES (HSP10)
MKITPLGNHVLLEPYEKEEDSPIVLPQTVEKEKSQIAKVLELGSGKRLKRLSLKKGELVIIEKYGPNEIEIKDKKYLLAGPEHILAKIKF